MTAEQTDRDMSLAPTPVNAAPDDQYALGRRPFQGIPGIERFANGRLFATWYSCRQPDVEGDGYGEGHTNYCVLATSDDDGGTWRDPLAVVDPPGRVRAFDPCLWIDPLGRLWWFWAQSYELWDGRGGVWAVCCEDPAAPAPVWSAPRRLCHGIMMNKPTVLRDGTWLLPAAVWYRESFREDMSGPLATMRDWQYSNVIASVDRGETWERRGGADVPQRSCDEHMVVELGDGRLWMLVRTRYGIGQSFSHDQGRTWSPGEDSGLAGPNSRFFVRRLVSGRLLLVNHRVEPGQPRMRKDLTAYLSTDDGRTWQGGLVLDEREHVSYPDGVEADDGSIYIIYDWSRKAERQILMAVFTEEDILAGQCASAHARLRRTVSVPQG